VLWFQTRTDLDHNANAARRQGAVSCWFSTLKHDPSLLPVDTGVSS